MNTSGTRPFADVPATRSRSLTKWSSLGNGGWAQTPRSLEVAEQFNERVQVNVEVLRRAEASNEGDRTSVRARAHTKSDATDERGADRSVDDPEHLSKRRGTILCWFDSGLRHGVGNVSGDQLA